MTDQYRINLYAADAHDYDTGESGPIARMILDGVLVPVESLTPRLQALADAWNIGDRYQTATRVSLRVAWPELAGLLDALGGTDNDD